MNIADGQGVEMVPALASLAPGHDQIGVFKHFEMHHHRAAVHVRECLAQRAGGLRLIFQAIQQFAPARMRQGLENMIVRSLS